MMTARTFTLLCREPTGVHMLDSGGKSGRAWQQPPIPSDQPIVTWDRYGPTIHTGPFLDYWFEVDDRIQRAFELFAGEPENDRTSWPELILAFAELRGWFRASGDNTYNGESDLSQVYQWDLFTFMDDTDDWYYLGSDQCVVAIQTHNGADVRGGYSSPLWVRSSDNGMGEEYAVPLSTTCGYEVVEARDADGDEINGYDVPDAERWQYGYSSWPTGELESSTERVFDFTRDKAAATVCILTKDGYRVKVRAVAEGVWV